MSSKYDPQKAVQVVTAVQTQLEQELQENFRQAQMRRSERLFYAGYEQAERDYHVGKFAAKTEDK